MKSVLLRYGVAGFLLVYWGLSFANRSLLHEPPFSPDVWKTVRLQFLLVTVSVAVTLVRLYSSRPDVQQELAGIIVLLTVMAHGLALLVPSLWLLPSGSLFSGGGMGYGCFSGRTLCSLPC